MAARLSRNLQSSAPPDPDHGEEIRRRDCGRSQFVSHAAGELHVRIWPGDPARTAVIWHGVTGSSLDHAPFAARLASEGYRVIAPDSPGCGLSDWAADQRFGYGLDALSSAALAILDATGAGRAAWLGASKGGGLGIRLAAEHPARIAALVLCDVGPGLPPAVRDSLARRLAAPPRFAGMAAFRAHIARMLARERIEPSEATVDRLAAAWARRLEDGAIGYHYDPALANQFVSCPQDFDLWPCWRAVGCPSMILHGAHSPALPLADLEAMQASGRDVARLTVAGAGHLLLLDDTAQQDAILAFLARAMGE